MTEADKTNEALDLLRGRFLRPDAPAMTGCEMREALATRLETECVVRENHPDDYCPDITKLLRECAAALASPPEYEAVAWRWRTRTRDNRNDWKITNKFSAALMENCIEFESLYAANPTAPVGTDNGEEMDDFIRAVLADNNPRSDEPYATVARWIRLIRRPPLKDASREAIARIIRCTVIGDTETASGVSGEYEAADAILALSASAGRSQDRGREALSRPERGQGA